MSPIGFDDVESGNADAGTTPRGGLGGDSGGGDLWNRWREAEPVIWQIWESNGDDRVCPICSPMQGQLFIVGNGPQPPLHPNCRCQRAYHHTAWTLR